jgi:pyruvate,water dikinase
VTEIGNKAKNLQILKEAGFNVPNFVVLPPDYEGNPRKIRNLLDKFVKPDRRYAVRSSGTLEDTAELSFAGQYYTELNVKGIDNIIRAAKKCYGSARAKNVTAYLAKNQLSDEGLGMAVVVQEMVNGDFSGVAFSVNPLSGADKEIVINVAKGLGDAIVSGQITPEEYIYNWYDDHIAKSGELLDTDLFMELANVILNIQLHFGYPVDIEFTIKDRRIYLLQTRAITKILYEGIPDEWSTADFKDGGVSATVCTPFMWSLYEYIWEIAYRKFLTGSMLLDATELGKLSDIFYGRPYWNLTKTKLAMARVVGYKEREFDEDLGIKPTYDGDGTTTGYSLKSITESLKILAKNKSQVRDRLRHNRSLHDALLRKYNRRLRTVSSDEKDWQELIFRDYLLSEGTYFEQIYVNTVAQSIYKNKLMKHVSQEGYLKLLMGLDDVSHLRPYRALWKLSRKSQISDSDIADFINEFGYHSDKELDVTYPHFAEEPEQIRRAISELANSPGALDPTSEAQKRQKVFRSTLDTLPRSLRETVTTLRLLLWWREEFRDTSTRFYYLIRLYTLELAKSYQRKRIIKSRDDIWFLKITDIRSYIHGETTQSDLRDTIRKNRLYYNSFRNYMSANEIGKSFDTATPDKATATGNIKGVGCSTGEVTGTARIIQDLSGINRLRQGDILVTKFTDTGWTSKFATLSGIVTEYGGVLCHAAIVSREFNIPCVTCAENAMALIEDGETITINGATGKITRGIR